MDSEPRELKPLLLTPEKLFHDFAKEGVGAASRAAGVATYLIPSIPTLLGQADCTMEIAVGDFKFFSPAFKNFPPPHFPPAQRHVTSSLPCFLLHSCPLPLCSPAIATVPSVPGGKGSFRTSPARLGRGGGYWAKWQW